MKYLEEYRDAQTAQQLARKIAEQAHAQRQYRFMEFCGGHTHAISRHGLLELLPSNVRMIHGPGCPVCVLPIGRIDMAIELALHHRVILCTYGDTLRVPASGQKSLLKAKALGGDVRMVYSPTDALKIAQMNPDRDVVFFAIGFETTAPTTAHSILQAKRQGLKNFSVLCSHVLTPAAIQAILEGASSGQSAAIDGFIGPAHVSIVIGTQPYEQLVQTYSKPVVVAGFEPLDVLQSILMLIKQVNEGRAQVENEFVRAVSVKGNLKAQSMMDQVFEIRNSFEWRGLGTMPYSALKIRPEHVLQDAEQRFALTYKMVPDNKACECGAILRGVKTPNECKIFGNVCTPENPIGSCMVSSEGACAAQYAYGRFRETVKSS